MKTESQLSFSLNEVITREYIPPTNALRLATSNVEVKRIRKMKELVDFCSKYHYLHQGEGIKPKGIVFSRAYGLYLGGDLAGVAIYNAPGSSAVEKNLFSDYEYQKGTLALTRLCCHPDAPFNSESHLIGQSIKLLAEDNRDRIADHKPIYKTIITYADYGLLKHTGTIYRSINAWYTGTTKDKSLAGFHNPTTGEIISARQGNKTLGRKDCPEGFEPFGGTTKFKYLMFIGNPKMQLDTMRHLNDDIKFRSKYDEFYVWKEGNLLRPSDKRSYDDIYNLVGRKVI